MNREKAFELLGELDGRFVEEAARYAPEAASGSPERIVHMKTRKIITFALAAALLLALGVTAYAGYQAVATPQAAERVALEQIEVWKKMGILSESVVFEGPANDIYEMEERDGGEYWYGRLFPHSYDVRFYGNSQFNKERQKYGCSLRVDTLTGKIMSANIDAEADADAAPVREEEIQQPVDPGDPNTEWKTVVWSFYDNYSDIFPEDMTVDRFCTLLAEYWGFSGYTIGETDDASYGTHFDPIDGSTLLKDLNADSRENYYLTVFFDGDQEGAPMYIQLHQFPGYVTLTLGTGHAVG